MTQYTIISENDESTVVAQYESTREENQGYQSEAELEQEFIAQLQKQAYEYLSITSEEALIRNLRTQLEKLNNYQFTENEWKHFFKNILANTSKGIIEKTKMIQEDHIQILHRDTGEDKNIYLIDKANIHNNILQVINQYEAEGTRANRYDVTILINGLPLVHVELKRRGVDIKEAFNQINRYQRESFWANSGLFQYIQIFVISNGTYTKYYSNTTRDSHIKEVNKDKGKRSKQTSNSFEFTSWWADATNTTIVDLLDFTKTFFVKHTILNIITKYCILNVDNILLVMRPYQIVATERILSQINIATNYKRYGTKEAGGYIWHTTGSGKTLTSFKTAQLASQLPYIHKVLFVVDRKDLDYQTMKEYDKFQRGSANSNTSTKELKQQLEDSNTRIIITTIQKLHIFTNKHKAHPIFEQPIVIIFDECHRSQFGDMNITIKKAFKKYYIFGFTGTPIFDKNANQGGNITLRTTEQAFGERLHVYSIVDAIQDNNVLPFHVEYIRTMKEKEDIEDTQIQSIDKEKALSDPRRIHEVVKYILQHFNQKTMRNEYYNYQGRNRSGFNSIFAVSSIDTAKAYYTEFKKQLSTLPSDKQIKIGMIYSFGANEDDIYNGNIEDENPEDTSNLDASSRDFLEEVIQDYNKMFTTKYDTSSQKFQNYYKDISERVKYRELDLLLVVNMFLTGFDATTINTLWVDKNLRYHGLLQAYSRTNRILNSIKRFGNIVCFRNLEHATNESFKLFGNKSACDLALIKSYDDYYYGYQEGNKRVQGYTEIVQELQDKYPIGIPIESEEAQKDFIQMYNKLLKARNILSSFDKFEGSEILSPRDLQDYQSMYIDLYSKYRDINKSTSTDINDDIVFELELVKQIEIGIDYILQLVQQYQSTSLQDKDILVTIQKSIDSSIDLRSKKDLIERFIASLTPHSEVDIEWSNFVDRHKIEELEQIIQEESLNREKTYMLIQRAFENGYLQTVGIDVSNIFPKMSRFTKENDRDKKRISVLDKLTYFFNKYFSISNKEFTIKEE